MTWRFVGLVSGELLFGAGAGAIVRAETDGHAVFGVLLLMLLLGGPGLSFLFMATTFASGMSSGKVPVSGRPGLRWTAYLAAVIVGVAVGGDQLPLALAAPALIVGMVVLIVALASRSGWSRT